MSCLRFLMLLFPMALLLGSCKDEEDPCVDDVLGDWDCEVDGTHPSGSCSFYVTLTFSTESGCYVIVRGLPYNCNQSLLQVRAVVSDNNITINSQPYGLETITGQGSVYLNQISLTTTISDGSNYQMVGTQ